MSSLENVAYGQYRIAALESALSDESELGLFSLLPARTISDKIWKPSVRDQFRLAGHKVMDDDTADQDTRECGRRREYKAARECADGKFIAVNSTRHPSVLVDLFVADGADFKDSGVYTLDARAIARLTNPLRNGKGWQLLVTADQLHDPEGLGAYRVSMAEYARRRMSACNC